MKVGVCQLGSLVFLELIGGVRMGWRGGGGLRVGAVPRTGLWIRTLGHVPSECSKCTFAELVRVLLGGCGSPSRLVAEDFSGDGVRLGFESD